MSHLTDGCTGIHLGINELQMWRCFSRIVPCEPLKMARYPFNKAHAIKPYTSCSADQTFGISEDYTKGLLCRAGTLIMSLPKLQLQLSTMHFSENPTNVHKERMSVASICWSEWVNGSLKAELCDHRDNGVFYNSLQPFRRLFLKQWQPL